jgi:hypothetical protein
MRHLSARWGIRTKHPDDRTSGPMRLFASSHSIAALGGFQSASARKIHEEQVCRRDAEQSKCQ